MVMKSKVRKAVRLAPVLASLSALAMVAACARTNGKTPISPERREKAATVTSASLFKDYNQNDEANMKFAEHFAGASIIVHGRDTEKVQATIKLMFDNHDPVIVRGMIPFGKENHAVDMPNADQNAKSDITVQAGCGGSDCQIVSAQITLRQEVDEATAQELSGAKGQAELSAMAKAADVTSTATADSTSKDASAAGSASEAAPAESTAEVKKVTVVQRNVIAFTIMSAASKEETLVQKNERLSKMGLILSGRTAKGPGSLKSFEDAFRAVTGEDAPADEQVEVLTASPVKAEDAAKDDVPVQPAPPEARDEQAGDDSSKEAAAVTKPAAASATTADEKAADAKPASGEQKAADTKAAEVKTTDAKATDTKAADAKPATASASAEAKPASTQQQSSAASKTATTAKPAAAATKSTTTAAK